MVWFCAMAVYVRVILSAKAVWAATKDVDVAKKVRIASIIVRKSQVDMEICCGGGANVLDPTDTVEAGGTRGTEGAKDVDDVGNGAMIVGASDGTI